MTVTADGTLVDVLTVQTGTANQAQPYQVRVMTSKDRGTTWSRPSALAPWRPIPVVDPESSLLIGYFGAVDVAADRNPASRGFGKLYAVWADAASTFDHRFPRGSHPGRDYTNVVFTESTDGGRTWTPPTEIDRWPPGVASFTPSVAVAADGTVGVTNYDVRNNTPEPGMPTDYWLVRCDGGTGCTSPAGWDETHVGGSFDVEQAPLCQGWYTLGLNMGLTTVGNSFYSLFTQTTGTDKASQYLAVTTP